MSEPTVKELQERIRELEASVENLQFRADGLTESESLQYQRAEKAEAELSAAKELLRVAPECFDINDADGWALRKRIDAFLQEKP